MDPQIFVNLPVKDLDKSKSFYEQLGFSISSRFTDETAACVVISDTIYVMLLTHQKFNQFTDKSISDATQTAQVLNAISADNKEVVDEIVDKAVQNGGSETRDPQNFDFMYSRSFNDPDGHIWEVLWMDMEAVNNDQ